MCQAFVNLCATCVSAACQHWHREILILGPDHQFVILNSVKTFLNVVYAENTLLTTEFQMQHVGWLQIDLDRIWTGF